MYRHSIFLACAWLVAGIPVQAAPAGGAPDTVEGKVRRATVLIRTKMSSGEGRGSGVILNSTGLVLTNNHVVDPNHGKSSEERAQVEHSIGKIEHFVVVDIATERMKQYAATLLHQSEACDVALLQLHDSQGKAPATPHHLSFIPDGSLRTGMKIKIMGFPGGSQRAPEPPTLTEGLATRLLRTSAGAISYLETDATVHPGNSGGPVVDSAGQLVGIASLVELLEGQKNRSGVVPAHLIKSFISAAFQQGRVTRKTDILPFVDLFLDENDIVQLPDYSRDPEQVTIHRQDGTVRRGQLSTERLNLTTPWGAFEVPTGWIGYILTEGNTSTALLDGGDELSFAPGAVSLSVKFNGRAEQLKLSDTKAVAFAQRKRPIPLLPGRGVIIHGQGCQLGLAELKGQVAIDGARYALADITSIDTDEKGARTVSTANGERLRGTVADQVITARIAWSAKPIQLRATALADVTVRPVEWAFVHARGRRLNDRLDIQDGDLKRIADLLEGPEWKKAQPLLEEAKTKKNMTAVSRRQLLLLQGIAMLRGGDLEGATQAFKKIPAREQEALVAQCYVRVLERYPDGKFLEQPLSEPDVMWRAGTGEARRILAGVDARLPKVAKLEEAPRVKALLEMEKELDIADRLELGLAQSTLIQVLEAAFFTNVKLLNTLKQEYAAGVAEANSRTTRGAFTQSVRKLNAMEVRGKMMVKELTRIRDRLLTDAVGFKIEPPTFEEKTTE